MTQPLPASSWGASAVDEWDRAAARNLQDRQVERDCRGPEPRLRPTRGAFEGYFICATKTVAAPVEAVYAAWTTDEALSRWFGPGSSADVRDGGSYANSDGDRGKFQRVRADKDLRLTFENPAFSAPTQVEVQLQDKGNGKTGLLVNHKRIQSRAEADGLRAAWGHALDRLKRHCES